MNFPFRDRFIGEHKSYADNTPHVTGNTLDCSLGVNPYGFPQEVLQVKDSYDWAHLLDYPHSHQLHDALCASWPGVNAKQITLANGSICGLYYLCNIFAGAPRTKVVGFVPTFTDMIESVKTFGMHYHGVSVRLEENGKACADDLIAAIDEDTALVYVDRPNNPTGQTLPLADMRRILEAARAKGAYVLADEAYGDFIPKEEASLALWGEYDNLIVAKTFSKGFGLANLRCGYVVAPEELTGYMAKTLNPYVSSDLNRAICAAALQYPQHPVAHGEDFAAAKTGLRAVTGQRITMLESDDRVPICTLALQEDGDLQALLMQHDVLTVSGAEFDALGKRYVRLRIPLNDQVNRLIEAVAQVEQGK